jgi:ribosomal protein S18 acetylase RimI-like enzyme
MSFVCMEAGMIVGTALCGHDGRRGFLYHVAVKPAYRGRHAGTRLVESCLRKLNAAGIDKCHVFVLTDNEVGNAFWGSSWKKREDIALYSKDV